MRSSFNVKRSAIYGALLSLLCTFVVSSGASAAGIVHHLGMGRAGAALPTGTGAFLSNPAGAAALTHSGVHVAGPLMSSPDEGYRRLAAYSEAGRGGAASGILAWSKHRRQAPPMVPGGLARYEDVQRWTYVVATSLPNQTSVGLAIHYDQVAREGQSDLGTGYFLDAGLLRPMTPSWNVGVYAEGLIGSDRYWPNDEPVSAPSRLVVGTAWSGVTANLAVDAVMNWNDNSSNEGVWLRAGASIHRGPIRLSAGVNTRGASPEWSAGVAYSQGETTVQYAYSVETEEHTGGLSWCF